MKKIKYYAIVLLLILGGFCTACQGKKEPFKEDVLDNIDIPTNIEVNHNVSGREINFNTERNRIGSYTQGKEFPYTRLYTNSSEYTSKKYNEEFFKTKALIVVGLRESSGSVNHKVKKVSVDKDKINIKIERIIPEIGTADMAEWEIYIEVNKEDIDNITKLNLII